MTAVPRIIAFLALTLLCSARNSFCQIIDSIPKLQRFIRSQETIVKDIANNATKWHADRIRLVRSCECSRHACSNDFLDVECVHHLGDLEMCKTDGRRVDYNNSIFRTPRGTNPKTLTENLKESICVYKKLEDVVRDYGRDEIGWIYIGKSDSSRFHVNGLSQGREMVTFADIQERRIHVMSRTEMNCGTHVDCTTLAFVHGISGPALDRRTLFWWWISLGPC